MKLLLIFLIFNILSFWVGYRKNAVDIDIKAIYMCYVQLSLLGIDAVLWRGDSLKQEYDHEPWRTPQHILRIFGLPKEGEKPIEAEKPDIDIGQQLSIFDLMKGE